MKRSEMIGRIVYQALSWSGLETNGVALEEIANDMLKVVEKAGMNPPYILDKWETNHRYEWEPEDEKAP